MKPNKIRLIASLIIMFLLFSLHTNCKDKSQASDAADSEDHAMTEEKLYRPNFHFTPKNNWMNDPNGMFYLNGKYHLYFQYYPEDNVWGPMHWGHTISEDLIHWKEQEIALYPDSLGYIFSGSAVVDHKNTSGLAEEGQTLVSALYTYHDPEGEKSGLIDFQTQGLAYSTDEGMTWTKYKGNPIIPNPGIRDFRDPKVTWDVEHEKWIMALAVYDETHFYSSTDLKSWEFLSAFGKELGAHGGVWECPDFIPMKVENSEEVKWVLIQSLNPGSANGGSGTQYFIGDFDGTSFILDELFSSQLEKNKAVWLDYGRDNYAGVTWSNVPQSDGRILFIGWMSNWDYAQVVPTETWRSAMTIARELKLFRNESGFRIHSTPVREMDSSSELKKQIAEQTINSSLQIAQQNELDLSKARIELQVSAVEVNGFEFDLSNEAGDSVKFGFDAISNQLYVNRSGSGVIDFSEKFANKVSVAACEDNPSTFRFSIFIDKTSIELFINDGAYVFTELFFPNAPMTSLHLNPNGDLRIRDLKVFELK